MLSPLRILLVENEGLIYRDLVRCLESSGDEVVRHPTKKIVDTYDDALALLTHPLPHLAILDIAINGTKNGLQVGEHISSHFWLPIIYLTQNFKDSRNVVAAGYQNAKAFLPKPVDKQQLALTIDLLRPLAGSLARERTLGAYFSVSPLNAATGQKEELRIRKKIEWDQILRITVKEAPRNNVLFYLTDGSCWVLYESLAEVEKKVPPFLVPFSGSEIVNIKLVDRSSKSQFIYYRNEQKFEISESHRKTALPLIRLFFSSF